MEIVNIKKALTDRSSLSEAEMADLIDYAEFWKIYEVVRRSGRFNMITEASEIVDNYFNPDKFELGDYYTILTNYSILKEFASVMSDDIEADLDEIADVLVI